MDRLNAIARNAARVFIYLMEPSTQSSHPKPALPIFVDVTDNVMMQGMLRIMRIRL
jgi:hypothetical protein